MEGGKKVTAFFNIKGHSLFQHKRSQPPFTTYYCKRRRLKPDKKKKNTNATKATNYHATHIYNVPTYKQLGKYVKMIEPVTGKRVRSQRVMLYCVGLKERSSRVVLVMEIQRCQRRRRLEGSRFVLVLDLYRVPI